MPDSHARYRSIVESQPLLVCRCRPDGVFEFVNDAYCAHFGRTRDELVGTNVTDLVPVEDRAALLDLFASLGSNRPAVSVEYRSPDADGRERVHRWTNTPIFAASGAVVAIQAIAEDITDRVRAEDAVRQGEERLRFFLDHAPGGLAMFDREMRYLAVNRRWQADYAPPGVDVIGRLHYEVCPNLEPHWIDAHRRALAGEVVSVERERVDRADVRGHWMRWEVRPWYDGADAVGGVVLFTEDITANVEAEEAARTARKDLADLIATIDGIVWEADARTFAFTFVSAQAERLLGYPVARWLDEPGFWASHIHPEDRDASVRYCVECTRAHQDHQFDYRMIAADGRTVWLQDRVTVHSIDGEPVMLRGVMVDITDRKNAEAALHESERRFRTLADTAPLFVWTCGADRRCDFFNRRRLDFTGGTLNQDVDGWAEALHPDDRGVALARYAAAFAVRAPFTMDYRLVRADGEHCWVSAHAVPRFDDEGTFAGYIGTGVDITERRRAEEARGRLEAQLRQSQKMEAMGTLAGGIAHDFNNILAAIGGNLELTSMDLDADHPAQEGLGEMRRAVRRATDLVTRILTFSRPETHEQRPIQLAPVIVEATTLLRSLIPAGVELSQRIAPGLPDVAANASQIHQVVVNLATNAWQAMEGGPGRIRIALERCVVDRALANAHRELRPGLHVCLAITDSGRGMDAATMERIFEPFFTTKEPGRGTGLGLSMVHGIARGHGGAILVESELGVGSTFRVYFPACGDVLAETEDAPAVPEELHGHGERILYVDDEEPLVSLSVRLLERLGYAVAGYTSVLDALAAFRAQPDAFDIVVTDYNMPAMSGVDFACEIMRARPALPVILASGYLRQAEADHARALGIRATIGKPHAIEEIGAALRRLLPARPGQTL